MVRLILCFLWAFFDGREKWQIVTMEQVKESVFSNLNAGIFSRLLFPAGSRTSIFGLQIIDQWWSSSSGKEELPLLMNHYLDLGIGEYSRVSGQCPFEDCVSYAACLSAFLADGNFAYKLFYRTDDGVHFERRPGLDALYGVNLGDFVERNEYCVQDAFSEIHPFIVEMNVRIHKLLADTQCSIGHYRWRQRITLGTFRHLIDRALEQELVSSGPAPSNNVDFDVFCEELFEACSPASFPQMVATLKLHLYHSRAYRIEAGETQRWLVEAVLKRYQFASVGQLDLQDVARFNYAHFVYSNIEFDLDHNQNLSTLEQQFRVRVTEFAVLHPFTEYKMLDSQVAAQAVQIATFKRRVELELLKVVEPLGGYCVVPVEFETVRFSQLNSIAEMIGAIDALKGSLLRGSEDSELFWVLEDLGALEASAFTVVQDSHNPQKNSNFNTPPDLFQAQKETQNEINNPRIQPYKSTEFLCMVPIGCILLITIIACVWASLFKRKNLNSSAVEPTALETGTAKLASSA